MPSNADLEAQINTLAETVLELAADVVELKAERDNDARGFIWLGLINKRDIDFLQPAQKRRLDTLLQNYLGEWQKRTGYDESRDSATQLEKQARGIFEELGIPIRDQLSEWYGQAKDGKPTGTRGQGLGNQTTKEQVESMTAQAAFSLYYFAGDSAHKWSSAGFMLWTMALVCEYRLGLRG